MRSDQTEISTELLEIPQQSVTRGFLELAKEARKIGVEKKQSFSCGEKFYHSLPK